MTTPITTSTTTNKGTPPDYDDTTKTITKTIIPGLPKAEAIAPAMVEGNTSLTTIGPCQLHTHRHTNHIIYDNKLVNADAAVTDDDSDGRCNSIRVKSDGAVGDCYSTMALSKQRRLHLAVN